jgi:hypothetical protein
MSDFINLLTQKFKTTLTQRAELSEMATPFANPPCFVENLYENALELIFFIFIFDDN